MHFSPDNLSSSKAFILCLLLGTGVFLFQAIAYWSGTAIEPGQLADADSYTRMLRVQHLQETGDWFDPVLPRSNPTVPETIQWSRLIDLILLSGGEVASVWLGPDCGLFLWAAAFSPLILLLCGPVLFWAGAPLLSPRAGLFSVLFLYLQPGILLYLSFGRPDHHGVLLLLLILTIGCTIRIFTSSHPGWPLVAGFCQALALSISIEALISAFLGFLITGLAWLTRGNPAVGIPRNYALGLWTGCLGGLLLSIPPSSWSLTETDRIGPAHLIAFGSVLLFWLLLSRFPEPQNKPHIRWGLAIAGALACLGLTAWAAPALFLHPQLVQNPRIGELWLFSIREYHPLAARWKDWPFEILIWMGPILVLIPAMTLQLFQKKKPFAQDASLIRLYFLLGCLGFGMLTASQIRWCTYVETFLVIPWAFLLDHLLTRIETNFTTRLTVLRAPLILCFGFGMIALGLTGRTLLQSPTTKSSPPNPNTHPADLRHAAAWLNLHAQPETILAMFDFGPELLYRTPHRVIGTPNHRNADGMLFFYDVLNESDDQKIREALRGHEVSLILLAFNSHEQSFLDQEGEKREGLYHRLLRGELPAFLKEEPSPEKPESCFRLFRVISNN